MAECRGSRSDLLFTVAFLVIVTGALGTARHGVTATRPAASSQPATRPAPTTNPARIETLSQAITAAQRTGRLIYVEFTADWCFYCRKYEREVLNTSEGRRSLDKVVYLQLNLDTHRALADKFKVQGIPTGVLLKADKGSLKVMNKHVGGLTKAELARFLGRGRG